MINANIKDDFKDLLEYRAWVKATFDGMTHPNALYRQNFGKKEVERTIRDYPSWYGEGATYKELEGGITEFKDAGLLDRVLAKVEDKVPVETTDMVRARRLAWNDRGLGVFCFDRAASSMYRVKEFHDPLTGERVDESKVRATPSGFARIDGGAVVLQRWETRPDGNPRVRTQEKRLHGWFPQVARERKAVEIFIGCGGHSRVKAEAFLYSGASAIAAARLFEQAGIKTSISIVIGSFPAFDQKKFIGCLVPAKGFNDPLDANLLALLSSDPRFFRHEGFKGLLSAYEAFKEPIPPGYGSGASMADLKRIFEDSTYARKAKPKGNRLYFGWTFDEDSAAAAVSKAMKQVIGEGKR